MLLLALLIKACHAITECREAAEVFPHTHGATNNNIGQLYTLLNSPVP